MRVHALELDLEVFAGPFDLLLTLVLREEVDLLEVDLAEVVLAYLDELEAREELDLEAATEFLVLIAALLELKSRLMLPAEGEPELDDLAPAEAADELLARLGQYARHRGAGAWLRERHEAARRYGYRRAPLPPALRRASEAAASAVYDPARLGAALGALATPPPQVDTGHMRAPRVSLAARLALLRDLLRRGSFSFDEAVAGADRATIAMTVWALLELHRRGEAGWRQEGPFAPITVDREAAPPAPAEATRPAAAEVA